jgi:putative hydrolases of HD superfamily
LPNERTQPMTALTRMINFFHEIGSARNRPRGWEQLIGTKMANVAEHTIRTQALAVYLAIAEGGSPERTAFIALWHDGEEVRTGDQTPFQKPYLTTNGAQAIEDMVADTPLKPSVLGAYKEYKARESIEAKCVKDADILDTVFELMELKRQGNHYPLQPQVQKQITIKRERYFTESARALHDAVTAPNAPSMWDWVLNGPSTFKDGSYGK